MPFAGYAKAHTVSVRIAGDMPVTANRMVSIRSLPAWEGDGSGAPESRVGLFLFVSPRISVPL